MNPHLQYYLLAFTITTILSMAAHAQQDHFKLVTMPRQEPAFNVNGMAQDKQGFLWLATSAALYKYDGARFTGYHNEPLNSNSLGGIELQAIAIDDSGRVWTAPHYRGLDRLDPATGLFTHFRHNKNDPNSLASDTVWSMLIDHTGLIWVGNSAGVDVMNRTSKTITHYHHDASNPSGISSNNLRIIYEDKAGTVWIGTGNAFGSPPNDTSGGLNRFDRSTGKFTRWLHDNTNKNSLSDSRVTALLDDSHGNFWVGTAGAGLHILNRKTGIVQRYPPDAPSAGSPRPPAFKNTLSFAVDHVTFIEEDAAGKIWIGSLENGINVYDPQSATTVHYGGDSAANSGMPDKIFWKAFKTGDNQLWLSTWTNNFIRSTRQNQATI